MKSIFTFILLLVIGSSTATAQIQTLERYLLSTAKLELRSGPGANYNIIGEIPQGTQVYVITSGYGEWSTVQYKNGNGFVLTNLLKEDNSLAEKERKLKEAQDKIKAAQLAAQQAIAVAKENARKAIAEAERLEKLAQEQAQTQVKLTERELLLAKQDLNAAEKRRLAELQATEEALRKNQGNVAQSGTVPDKSTSNAGSSNKPKAKAAPTNVTRENNYSSWTKKTYKNGATPKSFNFKGKYEYKLDNYLKIEVGKNTDVVVKLVKQGKTPSDDETVRIVYINSNQTQFIRNIPEGEYYCVIAYGKDWREEAGTNNGTFTKNALYERGKDVLNFYTIKTSDGINVPSYSLSLDLLPNGTLQDENYSDDISPSAFNKF
ncbi:SH3 domain-containing protein [Aquimarina addita]